MSATVNFRRLFKLINRDLAERGRGMLMVSAAIGVATLTLAGIAQVAGLDGTLVAAFLPTIVCYLWGFVLASRAFPELHDNAQIVAYLLLPASALEKMLTRLIQVSLLFPLYAIALITLLAALSTGLLKLLPGAPASGIGPMVHLSPLEFGSFLVNQSVFFLGAAWFRRLHMVKTILAAALIIGPLALIFSWSALHLLFPQFTNGAMPPTVEQELLLRFEPALQGLLLPGLLYFVGVPIFCWWVAWLRIRETQVSDGI